MDESSAKRPQTAKDYWHIGFVYVQKRVLLGLLAALAALLLGIFGFPSGLFPPLTPRPPAYRFDDPKLAAQSRVVRVLDAQGVTRYEGEVAQGAYTGRGKVYDPAGELVYDGPLVDGYYEGPDALVYQDGIAVYAGEMADNLYEGWGRRTDPASGIVSEGQFSRGMLEGEGQESCADGTLLRAGQFSRDLLEGEGMEYARDGTLLREGTFSAGVLHGAGKEYGPDGALVYEGEFRRGLRHGQGKLYDAPGRAPAYEGTFAYGRPVGSGRVYHPSGQLLYEGQVYDASPRADAFLGLSLAEVEAAFAEHWMLFSCDGVTGFVYPTFQLIFVTESPVSIVSPARQEEQARQGQQEQQDLADWPPQWALSGDAEEDGAAPVPIEALYAERGGAEGDSDEILSPDTDKKDIIICEALSYGRPLPGVAQPPLDPVSGTHAYGWREWSSDYASNADLRGASAVKTGQFIVRCTPDHPFEADPVAHYLAADAGVLTMSVLREDKDPTLWYQSVRQEGPAAR